VFRNRHRTISHGVSTAPCSYTPSTRVRNFYNGYKQLLTVSQRSLSHTAKPTMSTLNSAPKKMHSRSEKSTATMNTPSRHRSWSARELKAVYAQRLLLSGEEALSVRHDPRSWSQLSTWSREELSLEEDVHGRHVRPRHVRP
jgi:hypothetical protein